MDFGYLLLREINRVLRKFAILILLMNFVIILSAKYLFLVSLVIFVLYLSYLWRKHKAKCFAVIKLAVVSFPLTLLAAKISGYFIYDPRPFVVEHVKPLIAHAADNGFPSDHMLLTMA